MAQQLGGPVALDVYEGGAHDFFLRSGTRNADGAQPIFWHRICRDSPNIREAGPARRGIG